MESNPERPSARYSPGPVPSQTPDVDEFISEPYTNGDMRNQSPIDLEFAKTSKEAEVIRILIGRCTVLGSNSLDLSHKGLTALPRDILELKDLEVIIYHKCSITIFQVLCVFQYIHDHPLY